VLLVTAVRTQTLTRNSSLSKYHTVSRYKSKYNFTYDPNESTTVPTPIFTKLTNIQRCHVQITYKEFFTLIEQQMQLSEVRSSFLPLKVRFSMRRFSRNSQTFNSTMCGYVVENFSSKSDNKYSKGGQKFIYAPKGKDGFHCVDFHENRHHSIIICGHLLYRILPTRGKNVEIDGKASHTPFSKPWLSLHRFSRNLDLLNIVTWRHPEPSSTQIGRAMREVQVETYLRHQGSTNCHRTDFRANTTTSGHRHKDGRTDGRGFHTRSYFLSLKDA
jgi:hypothetical protein